MKEWNTYAQSRGGTKQAAGGDDSPKVSEYLLIKLSDNWLAVAVLLLLVLFSFAGLGCKMSDSVQVNETGNWFFEVAKITLGVFLGLLTSARK